MVKARRDQVAPYGRVTQAPGFAAALFVEIAFFMLLGCGADPEETELIDQQQDRLYGAVLNDAAGPHVAASALLTMTDGGQCSATLVRPDRILTAAHCLCNAPPANVMFAEANGQIPPPNENPPVYPVLNWQVPPRALVCGSSWVGLGDDDPNGHAPFDIAVLTIGPAPQTGLLPPFQFIPVFLDVPHLTGILTAGQEWAVGYGQNGPLSFTPETVCVGCGVRRAGQVNNVRSVAKSCPGGIDIDCWQGELWTAPSLATSFVETSRGDSGGGLFFNVNPPFPGGPLPVVGGVSSNWWDDEENRTRWARTSNSPDFLWSALGLPYDFSLQGQIDNAAISARLNVKINDRAHVVEFFNTNIGALILGSDVELGPDAVTGPIVARGRPITANDPNTLIGGNVRLADRALATNNVTSYGTIQLGNQAVITGLVEQGRFRKFEEFGLSVPFPNAGFTFQEQPNGHARSLKLQSRLI